MILPNLAYIGGLGELSYWLQLKGVFESAKIAFPLIQPRVSMLYIDENTSKRIDKLELSRDAAEILDVLLLTNAHYPEMNISKEQFLEIKSKWLIKRSNFDLIEKYLLNNEIINEHPKLTKHLVDHYLSQSDVKKACEIFSKINEPIQDLYLSKFNIYCLINNNKRDEAQLLIDLQLELGIADKFFNKNLKGIRLGVTAINLAISLFSGLGNS